MYINFTMDYIRPVSLEISSNSLIGYLIHTEGVRKILNDLVVGDSVISY
jgi:hypothetical protein